MGVDFFPCAACGETICDAGSYVSCPEGCGRHWCDYSCAEKGGVVRDEETHETGPCKWCRGEDVEDHELLAFLLRDLRLTREQAVKNCLDHKKLKKGRKKK